MSLLGLSDETPALFYFDLVAAVREYARISFSTPSEPRVCSLVDYGTCGKQIQTPT